MVEGFPTVLGRLLQILYFVQMSSWSCWICHLFILSKVKQSELETHPVMGNPCFRFYNLDILQILLWPTGIKAIMSNSGGNILKYLPQRQTFSLTRSYAALRAADLDWIVGPGYSLGRVHSGEKP